MEETTKKCPKCGQEIHVLAIKCRFCGTWLNERNEAPPSSSNGTVPPPPGPQSQQQQPNQNYQQQQNQNYQQQQSQNYQQPSYAQYSQYQQQPSGSNGMGVAGFVLALLGVFLGWIPLLGWIIWLLGLVFSIVGMTRKPKGLAIAGLVLSLVGLFILIAFIGLAGTVASLA